MVDDYAANLIALRALLEPLATVTTVDSGTRALAEIGLRDYAVIVLDIQMPRMGGIEVARRIRAGDRNAQVPIIFLTAQDHGAAPILDGYAVGAVDYLRRPIEPTILKSKVAIFVELYRSRERAREEAAARARAEAERAAAERASAEKDRFLAALSHELRTPLTSILLWSDMLLTKQDVPAATWRRGLETIDACARQEAHIVDNVLEMSRLVTDTLMVDLGPVDVDQLMADAVSDVARAAGERRVRVEPIAATGGAQVRGDRTRLRLVLHNVLENAVKFTPAGGRVAVTGEAGASAVRIRVEDTGVGFASGALESLFARFGQGDGPPARAQLGLGLGLTVAKALLELHDGEIAGESEGPNCGARFTISLPLAKVL